MVWLPGYSAIPFTFQPTLTEIVDDFKECLKNINDTLLQLRFYFSEDTQQLLRENIDQFVAEVNDAIREGKVPPKSKLADLQL